MHTMTPQEMALREKKEVAGEERTRPGRTYVPYIDICETKDSLWLWADMPGVDEHSVNIAVDNDVLTIEGHVSLKEYERLTPTYTEYNVGNFLRRLALSNDIDAERIRARMTNGVLELELPKAERAKPRRITVTPG
jgi:HSP20 family protein